jgi:hypothetical protein
MVLVAERLDLIPSRQTLTVIFSLSKTGTPSKQYFLDIWLKYGDSRYLARFGKDLRRNIES